MQKRIEVWENGFAQGQRFSCQCPYERQSPEMVLWRKAWLEGASKILGLEYEDMPSAELLMQFECVEAS